MQTQILRATGVRIRIVFDTVQAQEKEILLGSPDRAESANVRDVYGASFDTYGDYFIGVSANKLLIYAENAFALRDGAEWFAKNYILENKLISIPSELKQHGHTPGYEALAASINNRCDGARKNLETLETSVIYAPTDIWWFNHCQAVEVINGVMVASGHVSDSFEDQVRELNAIAAEGPDALILISNRMDIKNTSDEKWIADTERLIAALPAEMPLGVYEYPKPYNTAICYHKSSNCFNDPWV